MFKRCLTISLAALAFSIVSIPASALQINLNYADDFIANHDKLNFSIDLFHGAFPNVQESYLNLQGIGFEKTNAFAEKLKTLYSNIQPIKDPVSGRFSQMSLGIQKNGLDISPASCQNIDLSDKTYINIQLSETGCTIN